MKTMDKLLAAQLEAYERVVMALPEPESPTTYQCAECEDTGWMCYSRADNTVYAVKCNHADPSGRLFGFPQGLWVYAGKMPAQAQEFCDQFAPSKLMLLTMQPRTALNIALACCKSLSEFAPKYVDMMNAPISFDESDETFLSKHDSARLLAIDGVDRRLRPPQVRTLISLIHRKPHRPAILIGTPPSQHPANEPWRALGLELSRRGCALVGEA